MKNNPNWQAIGDQTKKVREELFNLHRMTTSKMPVAIVGHISNAIKDVDRFKNVAEERMFKTGGPQDTNIFYGPNTEKNDDENSQSDMTFKTWIKQYKNENNPIGDLARDIVADVTFPSSMDYKSNLHYLERKTSWSAVFETFEEAWAHYETTASKTNVKGRG